MFRRTSHCVCPPESSYKVNPLKSDKNFQINAPSNHFLMQSPPLPPRTIKNNFTSTESKFSSNKSSFYEWNDKTNNYDEKSHCNCSRPHSCPAEESSVILTPPIPPKTCTGVKSKSQKQITDKQQLKTKNKQVQNDSRKSSRHRGSEKSSTRKKSRSNSRSVARENKSQQLSQFLPDNVENRLDKYIIKNQDGIVNKHFQKAYQKPNELCKICENKEQNIKFQMRSYEENTNSKNENLQITVLQPDLIADRSNPTNVIISQSQNKSSSNRIRNKWKAKILQLWTKSKKSIDITTTTTAFPLNTDNVITPENSSILKFEDETSRPRRSKSLHLIPDASLSPKTSMQTTKLLSQTTTDVRITKNSSIFAVISPSTARWKRNLFCISPKAASSNNKKSDHNMSVTSTANNCQQRNPSSSVSGGRISPVHLIAKSSNTSNINNHHHHLTESTRREKEPSATSNTHSFTKQNRHEKSELLNSKISCGSKPRNRVHQDNVNKQTQLSNLNQSNNINNSVNQICPCHSYHFNDNHFPCNNAYPRFCSQIPCVHNNQSCQIYKIDTSTDIDIGTSCSQMCSCTRNLVHFSPNHFHCCHPQNSNAILCSGCRVPIFCASCSFNCYNPNTKSWTNKQPICHHSTSPPPCLSRQVPPPPPPPANAFSGGHHFPRKNRQSYSKTPPPSFHTHQHSCHDDHCYQEYNFNFSRENYPKHVSNKSRTCNFSNVKSNCCCQKPLNSHCHLTPHSKWPGCGSFIYDELSNISTHYNMNGFHKTKFANTPTADSLLEIKWRNTEQGLNNQCRLFTSSVNNEENSSRFCHHNHCSNRQSGPCSHYSNEMKTSCCRNRDKQIKRRKSSSHSCHGSNLDPDVEEKLVQQQELSRNHFSSPNNLLPTNSIHISPDLNPNNPNSDLPTINSNNLNINSTINMTSSSISGIQITNLVDSNDKFEPWRKTFKENMLALRNLGWYWGPLNHLEAENLVENRPDGTFLVRDSAHDTYFLSLTFRVLGTTYHTRIEYSQGKFSFWSQPESHSATTIVEFIDKAVAHSASGKFHYFLQTSTPGQPPMEVSLLFPLSRYQIVQSLQHLSRFVILSNIRKDHVSQLELPSSLKGYLLEKQYYIDNIEEFVILTKDAEPLVYKSSRNLISNIKYSNNNNNNNNTNNV